MTQRIVLRMEAAEGKQALRDLRHFVWSQRAGVKRSERPDWFWRYVDRVERLCGRLARALGVDYNPPDYAPEEGAPTAGFRLHIGPPHEDMSS